MLPGLTSVLPGLRVILTHPPAQSMTTDTATAVTAISSRRMVFSPWNWTLVHPNAGVARVGFELRSVFTAVADFQTARERGQQRQRQQQRQQTSLDHESPLFWFGSALVDWDIIGRQK